MSDSNKSDRDLLIENRNDTRWIKSGVEEIQKRNAAHDLLDNDRFASQGQAIEKLDKKIVWASGVCVGAMAIIKFIFH